MDAMLIAQNLSLRGLPSPDSSNMYYTVIMLITSDSTSSIIFNLEAQLKLQRRRV